MEVSKSHSHICLKSQHSASVFISFSTSACILSKSGAILFFSGDSAHLISASSMGGPVASFGRLLVVKVCVNPGGPLGSGYIKRYLRYLPSLKCWLSLLVFCGSGNCHVFRVIFLLLHIV